MVTGTDTMQKSFNAVQKDRKEKFSLSNQKDMDQVLVVPVDWACAEAPLWQGGSLNDYYEDQECSEKAGRVIGKFLSGLKRTNSQKLNIVAHSMVATAQTLAPTPALALPQP